MRLMCLCFENMKGKYELVLIQVKCLAERDQHSISIGLGTDIFVFSIQEGE